MLSARPSSFSTLSAVCVHSSRSLRTRYNTTTASNRHGIAYKYPTHPNPTPHQIFHLPSNASQDIIKSRYYELVKIYHPDSPASRSLSQETAEARFQAITNAYEFLRKGKHKAIGMHDLRSTAADTASRRRRSEMRRRAELNVGMDERWKERLMVGALMFSVVVFVYQTFDTRRQGLAAALENGRHQRRRSNDFGTGATGQRGRTTIQDEESLALSGTES